VAQAALRVGSARGTGSIRSGRAEHCTTTTTTPEVHDDHDDHDDHDGTEDE